MSVTRLTELTMPSSVLPDWFTSSLPSATFWTDSLISPLISFAAVADR